VPASGPTVARLARGAFTLRRPRSRLRRLAGTSRAMRLYDHQCGGFHRLASTDPGGAQNGGLRSLPFDNREPGPLATELLSSLGYCGRLRSPNSMLSRQSPSMEHPGLQNYEAKNV
jgi:hypothetical protein